MRTSRFAQHGRRRRSHPRIDERLQTLSQQFEPATHPVAVARQVSSLSMLAPGRLVFGVGMGGDDPHELEVCGVDPRTRGRRMDECLTVVRGLLAGSVKG